MTHSYSPWIIFNLNTNYAVAPHYILSLSLTETPRPPLSPSKAHNKGPKMRAIGAITAAAAVNKTKAVDRPVTINIWVLLPVYREAPEKCSFLSSVNICSSRISEKPQTTNIVVSSAAHPISRPYTLHVLPESPQWICPSVCWTQVRGIWLACWTSQTKLLLVIKSFTPVLIVYYCDCFWAKGMPYYWLLPFCYHSICDKSGGGRDNERRRYGGGKIIRIEIASRTT